MSENLLHPSVEELTAFSLGRLAPQEATIVEDHIGDCKPCCDTLLGLSTDDTFVALLKDTKQPDGDLTIAQNDNDLTIAQSDDALQTDSLTESVAQSPLADHPRYRVLELIGKGGMGDVYKAEHRMMQRTVALKVINRGSSG